MTYEDDPMKADGSEATRPAFAEGKQAFTCGKRMMDNPYGYGDDYDSWSQGWSEALTEDKHDVA